MDPTGTTTRGPRERVRTEVMAAARALLAEGSFASFSMEALARRAGVSKATVYRWWSNRSDVAMDVLLEAAGPQTPYLHAGSALANLRTHIQIAARFLGGPDAHMLAGIVADAQHDAELADAFRRRYLSERRKLIIGLMHDAIESGELAGDTDAELLADRLIGPMYYRLLLGHAPVVEELADALFDLTIGPQDAGRRRTR